LRVLHFASSYFPVPGGTTTRLANMLADAQHEHVLVVPRPTAAQCPEDLIRSLLVVLEQKVEEAS